MLPGQGVSWTRRYQNKVLPGHGFTLTMEKVLTRTEFCLDNVLPGQEKMLPRQGVTWTWFHLDNGQGVTLTVLDKVFPGEE